MHWREPHFFARTAIAGALFGAFVLGLSAASAAPQGDKPAPSAAAPSEGEKLAFSRAKGNCLTCHAIAGGEAPGNVAPPLVDMKARFPDRKELIAIIADETKRNPLTVMPPFKRNLILDDKEIEAIADFLYTR
jgi:sulfur-oxidizing protein SoxX